MKIFFKGYYGFENLGDDIFVHTIKWFSNKYGYKYIVHGYNLPENTKGRKIRNKFEKNWFDIYYSVICKKIIYWGGSTFEKNSSKTDLKFYLTRIKFFREKLFAFGISVGPFVNKKEENSLLTHISKLKYVGVRDKKSLNYNLNFNFTFDLAILCPDIIKVEKVLNNNKKIVSINISQAENIDEYILLFKKFLLVNRDKISKVNIIIFNPEDFYLSNKFYIDIKKYIENAYLINYSSNTVFMLSELANSDLMLGNRLHSGILAYAYRVPFILNEYHEKCTEFIKTIEQEFNYESFKNSIDIDLDKVINKAIVHKNPEYFKNILINELEILSRKIDVR